MRLDQNAKEFARLLEIARKRDEEVGTILVPQMRKCSCCSKKKTLEFFPRLAPTALTRGSMDIICDVCAKAYAAELKQLCRLVCAGCSEVITIFQPGAARGGFVFRSGGVYHVANCPVCKDPPPKKSTVLEMILFYRENNIPYE